MPEETSTPAEPVAAEKPFRAIQYLAKTKNPQHKPVIRATVHNGKTCSALIKVADDISEEKAIDNALHDIHNKLNAADSESKAKYRPNDEDMSTAYDEMVVLIAKTGRARKKKEEEAAAEAPAA